MSRTLSQFHSLQQQSNSDDISNYLDDSMEQHGFVGGPSAGGTKGHRRQQQSSSVFVDETVNNGAMDQFLSKLQDEEFFYDETDMNTDPSTQFASITNFSASLQTLSTRLLTQNLITQPLSFDSTHSQVHILNLIYRLLMKRQQDIEFRENLADQMSRLQCDNRNLKNNLQRCKNDLEGEKRQLAHERIRFKTKSQDVKKQLKKLNAQIDKAKLDNQNLLQKQIQYEHKLHRQEFENNKLKDRVQKLVQSKGGLPNKMDLVNAVPKKDGRSAWKHGTKQNEDSLYQNIVGAFQDEKQEIVQENSALRQSLRDLTFEIHQLRNVMYAKRRSGDSSQVQHIDSDLNDGQFEIPFHIVQDEIEGTVQDKIQEIQDMLHNELRGGMESLEGYVGELQRIVVAHVNDVEKAARAKQVLHKLRSHSSRYEKIIEEQNILLHCDTKQMMNSMGGAGVGAADYYKSPLEPGSDANHTSNTLLEEERDLLEERRRTLDERQQELEHKAMELDRKALRLAQEQEERQSLNRMNQEDEDESMNDIGSGESGGGYLSKNQHSSALMEDDDDFGNKENIPE
eukprot:CAMPEP_0117447078 /NCGR_PEP_ID=MMETSP0759-20121206/6680_1 /TAXON_ID=63605 /ORGANISM="Percolomonas cosmopolitus, Strain WS" /LENGTH=567 /DNA_ID=CAMNT_0005239383 /DNA_START=6 /DNA_END=1709 /DNA_ORIENTATION=-